jgi:MerR family transcriptional regulator, mercuric resistance operon regulatory protein
MSMLTIGRLARAAGVHVETIRYYQRRGLIAEPRRPSGGVRRYGPDAQARIRFVKRAQDLGFTLEEVKALLMLGETPNCRGARALAAVKLQVVESRIHDLARMREALRSLIRQCDSGRKRSCPIIENLGAG